MRLLIVNILLCLTAALLGWRRPAGAAAGPTDAAFAGWPATFEGRPLRPQPLDAREEPFVRDFSGRIAKFTDGERQIIFRWTATPTRKLHLSADCFRAAGYRITPQSALSAGAADPAILWSRFVAERDGQHLMVSERIYDQAGNAWPDASSWYWAASLGQTAGPWWAVTVIAAPPAGMGPGAGQ